MKASAATKCYCDASPPGPPTPEFKIVLKGYDMVEYFVSHTAVVGKKEFNHTHRTYDYSSKQEGEVIGDYHFLFKSAENAAEFAADPWKYAPRYGGF